eukprot:3529723-Rhodomonas_salina.1
MCGAFLFCVHVRARAHTHVTASKAHPARERAGVKYEGRGLQFAVAHGQDRRAPYKTPATVPPYPHSVPSAPYRRRRSLGGR